MNEEPIADNEHERRRATRVVTNRVAMFSGTSAAAMIGRGTAVDISRDGLKIITHQPEAVGSLLEIELKPKDDDEKSSIIFVEAYVVHVSKVLDNEFAMGLRLRTGHAGLTAIEISKLERHPSRPPGMPQEKSFGYSSPADMEIQGVEYEAAYRRIDEASKPSRKKRRWYLLLILLLLLLLFAGGTIGIAGNLFNRWSFSLHAKNVLPDEKVKPEGLIPQSYGVSDSPQELLVSAQALIADGKLEEAEKIFSALQANTASNPTEQFLAKLGRAEALGAMKKSSLALVSIQDAFGFAGEVHEVWLSIAREIRFRLFQTKGKTFETKPLREALVLEEEEAHAPGDSDAQIQIVIDSGKYTLTILRDGVPLRTYPVGLGCNDATPTGNYTIANKLTNPDWYNKGNVVKSGDPENPIGSRWMSLGNERGSTPYGIHPTNDLASINQPMSKGCIRMRPEDAETLFRLVPIGTPVNIGTQ